MKPYPLIRDIEWIEGSIVRVFFATGRVAEIPLPIKSARRAKIVIRGLGLDPGDGMEISATRLYDMRGKTVRKAIQTRA